MLLLGGRSKIKKKKKKLFQLAAEGLITVLVFTMMPVNMQTVCASEWNNAYTYYQTFGNDVRFRPTSKTDGNIYYGTKAAEGTTNIRYRTIGWKVTVKNMSGKTLQTLYFKLGGSYMNRVHTCKKSGYEYDLYAVSLYNIKRRLNSTATDGLKKGKIKIILDACMCVVKKGKPQGSMNDNGPVSGNVYTTYSGIAGAAPWGSASYTSFPSYFNKTVDGLFYPVEVDAEDGIAYVSGNGYYCYGSRVTVEAVTKTGYDFEMWYGDYRGGNEKLSFYVNDYVHCTARAIPKKLEVVFYRNLNSGDRACYVRQFTYGTGSHQFERMPWKVTGKRMRGWSRSKKAIKQELSEYAVLPDNWIVQKGPRMELYAVWEEDAPAPTPETPTKPTPTPETPTKPTPTPETPTKPTPTPETPTKPTPTPETPTKPTPTPETPTKPTPTTPTPHPAEVDREKEIKEGKRIISCRFISDKYFEDSSGKLIAKEKGGLDPSSRWVTDSALRQILRQILKA